MNVISRHTVLILRAANCADVHLPTYRAEQIAFRSMTKEGYFGKPNVVFFVECATVDIEAVANIAEFIGLQFGAPRDDDPKSGTALAVDAATCRLMGKEKIVKMAPAGEGIRARYGVSDRIKPRGPWRSFRGWAVHANPRRAPEGTKKFFRSLRMIGGVKGGDMNKERGWMRANVSSKYRGTEVMGFVLPKWMWSSEVHTVNVGSDHPAVDIMVKIPRKRFRRG